MRLKQHLTPLTRAGKWKPLRRVPHYKIKLRANGRPPAPEAGAHQVRTSRCDVMVDHLVPPVACVSTFFVFSVGTPTTCTRRAPSPTVTATQVRGASILLPETHQRRHPYLGSAGLRLDARCRALKRQAPPASPHHCETRVASVPAAQGRSRRRAADDRSMTSRRRALRSPPHPRPSHWWLALSRPVFGACRGDGVELGGEVLAGLLGHGSKLDGAALGAAQLGTRRSV